jgi:hypothetical protein
MKAVQFFLNLSELREYAEKFYGNGMNDLEARNLEKYDHFIVQFQIKDHVIIEEVWGVIPQLESAYSAYGERIGYFEYEKLEWIQDALAWLQERVVYAIYE